MLSQREKRNFKNKVWRYYRTHGRSLPWRRNITPYRIVVSEIMLQQTQVPRVIPKYKEFLRVFPTWKALSKARLDTVMRLWQGLGYNRRALALQETARRVVGEYNGRLPKDPDILKTFSGIGSATASSVAAFAFNVPTVFIETNIRSVFIYHFFPAKGWSASGRKNTLGVHDEDIFPLIEQTLDTKNPREWYFALMDYGVALKAREGNPSRQSTHYARQTPFKESNRYIRGQIIKLLAKKEKLTLRQMQKEIDMDVERIKKRLNDLEKEGFLLSQQGKKYSLASDI